MIWNSVAFLDVVGMVTSKENIFWGDIFLFSALSCSPPRIPPHSVAPPDQCSDQEKAIPLRLNPADSRTVNWAHRGPLLLRSSRLLLEVTARAVSFIHEEKWALGGSPGGCGTISVVRVVFNRHQHLV